MIHLKKIQCISESDHFGNSQLHSEIIPNVNVKIKSSKYHSWCFINFIIYSYENWICLIIFMFILSKTMKNDRFDDNKT